MPCLSSRRVARGGERPCRCARGDNTAWRGVRRRTLHFDLFDLGRMQRKLSLDAFPRNDPADDKHFARAATAFGDNNARKDLNALFAAFEDLGVNVDGIADGEAGNFLLEVVRPTESSSC
jgi:hypothetical protein